MAEQENVQVVRAAYEAVNARDAERIVAFVSEGFVLEDSGPMRTWENAYLATRLGGSGILLSAGTGEIMAELLTQQGRVPYRVKRLIDFLSPTAPEP